MEDQVQQLGALLESELAGTGLNAQQKANIVKKVTVPLKQLTQAAAAAASKAPVSIPKARFLQRISEVDPAERLAINQGQREWSQFRFYKRTQILSGANDQVIWNETNIKGAGQSNLDKNQMLAGSNMLIGYITCKWGFDPTATITNPALADYTAYGNIPASLVNAEHSIQIGGRVVVDHEPLCFMFAQGTNAGQAEIGLKSSSDELEKDIALWRSNEPIIITIHFPTAGTLPVGNHFLEYAICGQGMRMRAV